MLVLRCSSDDARVVHGPAERTGLWNDVLGMRRGEGHGKQKKSVEADHGVFAMPNVRAKGAPTAGRQARAGENVPRTARPGLVARRWCPL